MKFVFVHILKTAHLCLLTLLTALHLQNIKDPELQLQVFVIGLKSTNHLVASQHHFYLCKQQAQRVFFLLSFLVHCFSLYQIFFTKSINHPFVQLRLMDSPNSLMFCLFFLVTSAKAYVLLCHRVSRAFYYCSITWCTITEYCTPDSP